MIKAKHLAVIAVLSSAIANPALAQEVGEPGARPNAPGCTNLGSSGRSIGTVGNSTVWQAPVGHCQPRVTDIPEQSKDLAILDHEDVFVDSKISICRGC
jgi:hypothetical protein